MDVLADKATWYGASALANAIDHPWYAISGGLQIARLTYQAEYIALTTCLGSALIWGLEKRYLATIGYMSLAAGWPEFANAMLAFHYGLMSFDAEDVGVAESLTSAGLALAYSAENFQDTPHE